MLKYIFNRYNLYLATGIFINFLYIYILNIDYVHHTQFIIYNQSLSSVTSNNNSSILLLLFL